LINLWYRIQIQLKIYDIKIAKEIRTKKLPFENIIVLKFIFQYE